MTDPTPPAPEVMTRQQMADEIATHLQGAVERALATALADLTDQSPEYRDAYARGFRDAAIVILGRPAP